MFSRLELLVDENINKLYNAKVIIFGVGGVGGYVAEMLVRSGIGHITIVDYDTIDITNKNRQIIALDSTIDKSKVNAWKERMLDINPNIDVVAINDKLIKENIEGFNLKQFDYIIDAIDMVSSKIALIDYAHKNNIKIISAMGAGNRIDIPECVIGDIYETNNDGLAKVLRHNLRKLGVSNHKVVYFKNKSIAHGDTRIIGSIAYYPAISGAMLSAKVINDLLARN